MKKNLAIVAVALFAGIDACAAAPTAPAIRAEIDTLLDALQSSGCQFNRNDTWHSAAEAKDHILRKLEHIEGRHTIKNTEQFIELAASKSSSSGKPYLVRCGNEAPVESAAWLNKQLVGIRAGKARP